MSDDGILPKAFRIEQIADNFDPLIAPSTGQEYLQHVVYEASQCPAIVVAEMDRRKMQNHIDIKLLAQDQCRKRNKMAPSLEWQQQQVVTFSDLRQKVAKYRISSTIEAIQLPRSFCEDKWYNYFFGNDDPTTLPFLRIVLSMNESLLGRLLEYHVEWLKDGLKPDQGRWIYALLACLSLPLTPIICSVLRDLARHCARLRSNQKSREDSDIINLNLFICLVGKYFGQVDLAD